MRIGEIIQNHLSKNDMSQRQFAKKCGLSNGYISMLINNVNPKTGKPLIPSLSALMALANGLGISLDELFNVADDIAVNIGKIEKIPVAQLNNEDIEIIKLFTSLSLDKQKQALDYIRYLVTSSNNQ